MNVEYFISKRLFTAKENNNRYTRPILFIAILSIALSVAVMLISIMVVTGFKKDISEKVIGFNSHITITKFTENQSYETEPISIRQDFYPLITEQEGIKHIQIYATKAALVKTDDEILGVLLKGVGSDFNSDFFKNNLVEGEIPIYNDTVISNQVLISRSIANLLQICLNDKLIMYFINNPPRVRRFIVTGIYETGFSDLDDLVVVGDIKVIQRLNNWNDSQVGGFEITIDHFEHLEQLTNQVYNQIGHNLDSYSVKERMPQIFDWLDLQDMNVKVILILMLVVGIMNMVTMLLILILERTRFIGILKALGASQWNIRKIFLYNALYIIIKGVILGNLIGLGLGFLQKKFAIFHLDAETYYMSTIPINFDITHILLLNLGTIIICYIVLILPSFVISRIPPIKAIRFE